MKYIDENHIPTDRRPLGYWLRAIEGPLRDTMRNAFATFGVTRREWRTLTTLHAGPATAEQLREALPPRRHDGERPLRPGHRTLEQLLESFVNRGWATVADGSYTLTAVGERSHDAVLTTVQTVRAQVTAGIADADNATTMTTLEKIATNVGFDPAAHPVRGRGHGHRHGMRPAR
jgi:hypothetical protein